MLKEQQSLFIQDSLFSMEMEYKWQCEQSEDQVKQINESSNQFSLKESEEHNRQNQPDQQAENTTEKLGQHHKEELVFKSVEEGNNNKHELDLLFRYDKKNLADFFGNLFTKKYRKQAINKKKNEKKEKMSLGKLSNMLVENEDFRESSLSYLRTFDFLDDILSSSQLQNVIGPIDQIDLLYSKLSTGKQITQFKSSQKRRKSKWEKTTIC